MDPAKTMTNEAYRLRMAGQLTEAEELYRQALPGLRAASYAVALNNLARVRAARGDWKQAQRLHEEALRRLESEVGPRHTLVAKAAANLADVYLHRKQFARALPLLERAVAIESDAANLERLAWAEFKCRRLDAAIAHQELALSLRAGQHDIAWANSAAELATLYYRSGRFGEATATFASAIPVLEQHWGQDDARLLAPLGVWREVLLRLEERTLAERLAVRATRIRVRAALR